MTKRAGTSRAIFAAALVTIGAWAVLVALSAAPPDARITVKAAAKQVESE